MRGDMIRAPESGPSLSLVPGVNQCKLSLALVQRNLDDDCPLAFNGADCAA
jgi:hypothetical protein